MLNVSSWSIKRPVPALMLFMLLTLLGLFSFKKLAIQDFPDIDLPTVTVSVSLPGGTPSQLETEVTRKIEDAVASLGQVKHIRSTLTEGSSMTSIEFELEKDSQEAVDEVRDAVTRVRSQLPNDVREPQVSKVKTGGQAVLTYAVEGSGLSPEDLSWFVDNNVSKALLSVKDVSSVTRQGGVSREVQVVLDNVKLRSFGITAAQVSQQLKLSEQEVPSGSSEIGGQNQTLRTLATVKGVKDLEHLVITSGDGRALRLSDIATVKDTYGPVNQTAFVGEKEVVSFQVYRSRGASDVAVAEAVRSAVRSLQTANPGVSLKEVSNNTDRVKKSYKGSIHSLYEGGLLAIAVVWLFLKDWRATLVSAVALPLSVIPTFFVMDALYGFTLNTITLLALTLVVGILVDDAIVEVENIVRHLRMGKSPYQAAMDAAQEIGLAVIATTLTLVAVFLPTAFMGGIPGKFFKQFGWTASIAVLASLLVARLLTPMMAAYTLKAHPENPEPGQVMRKYLSAAHWCLRNPWKTLGYAGLFFVASLVLMSRVPTEFMSSSDMGKVTISMELPPGAAFGDTVSSAQYARQLLKDIPEVTSVYTSIGTGATAAGPVATSAAGDARKGTIQLNLTDASERKRSQRDIESIARERLKQVPGVRFSFGTGNSGEKYSVTLAGDDSEQLILAADRLEAAFRKVPGLGNVTTSASLLRPEIVMTPKWDTAAEAGVTAQTIGQALRVALSGDYDTSMAKLNLPERQLAIRVWNADDARKDLESLKQLRIPAKGGAIPLENVADLRMDSGPAEISRQDRQRNVTVSVELNGARIGEVSQQIAQLPEMQQLPAGVKVLPSGDLERMQELFGSFGLAMAAGVLCVYVVLVLLFHSFAQPLTIMVALPLSAGGAFGLLSLVGYSMSMSVLIGLLMLMGIVTKNSILLVEYALVAQQERGLSRMDALLDACAKRAQPIVMTTVAMAAGMLPIALGYNGEAAFRSPMATAVIGGLLTSTLLSLLVVPVVYEQVDILKSKVFGRFRKADHS